MDKKTGEIFIDAFGVPHVMAPSEALKCDEHLIPQYDLVLNKDTGCFETVVTGEVDLTEVIQSNVDNCGLNLALLNISKGVPASNFADDGNHGGDFSASTNVNEAYQAALASKDVAQKAAQDLGIDDYQNVKNLDEVIAKAVEAKLKAALAAQNIDVPGGENNEQ